MAKAITKIEASITTLKRGASTLNRHVKAWCFLNRHVKAWCFLNRHVKAWCFLNRRCAAEVMM